MPLPELDSTGRGPHTENAQGGCQSRLFRINHLPFSFYCSFPFHFKKIWSTVILRKSALFQGHISSVKHSRPCLAPIGAHRSRYRPARLFKISITTDRRECDVLCHPTEKIHFSCGVTAYLQLCASPPLSLLCRCACALLPASRGREGMESGEGKHFSSVRHLLPQMTRRDCRESRMDRSPFTDTGQMTATKLSVSLRPHRWPPLAASLNQMSLLSTIKSAFNHPHRQGKKEGVSRQQE